MNENKMINKAKAFLRKGMYSLSGILVIGVYVLRAFLDVGFTGKSVWSIIADAGILIFAGITIDLMFEAQGISDGRALQPVIETEQRYEGLLGKVRICFDGLNDFCSRKNKKSVEIVRRNILMVRGYKYEAFFDEEGYARPYVDNDNETKSVRKHRYAAFKRARDVRILWISVPFLTSESRNSNDPNSTGRSISEFLVFQSGKDYMTKLLCGLFVGLFGVSLVKEFSFVNLIWTLLQAVMLLAVGILNYFSAKMYVLDEYKGRISFKSNLLEEFLYEQEQNKPEEEEQKDGV